MHFIQGSAEKKRVGTMPRDSQSSRVLDVLMEQLLMIMSSVAPKEIYSGTTMISDTDMDVRATLFMMILCCGVEHRRMVNENCDNAAMFIIIIIII